MNSRSKIFFTTFCGRDAARLNGPPVSSELVPKLGGLSGEAADAAVTSMSSPDVEGVKIGSRVAGLLTS